MKRRANGRLRTRKPISKRIRYLILFIALSVSAIVSSVVTRRWFMPEPEIIETDCIEFTIEIQHSNLEEDKENKNEAEPTKTNKATASYYTTEYCEKFNPSCLTASGDVFTDEGFTAACADSFDLGDRVLLTSEEGSVEVVCNDRGSFEEKYGRAFDLSTAAFTKLAALSQGVVEVEYQVIK